MTHPLERSIQISNIAIAKSIRTFFLLVRAGGLCIPSGDFNRCVLTALAVAIPPICKPIFPPEVRNHIKSILLSRVMGNGAKSGLSINWDCHLEISALSIGTFLVANSNVVRILSPVRSLPCGRRFSSYWARRLI